MKRKGRGGEERTSASGSSVMKIGYINMSLVKCLSACKVRKSGLK